MFEINAFSLDKLRKILFLLIHRLYNKRVIINKVIKYWMTELFEINKVLNELLKNKVLKSQLNKM